MSNAGSRLTELGMRKRPPTLEKSLLNGLIALRWGTLVWMAAVQGWELYDRQFTGNRPDMPHPLVAWSLIGAAALFTGLTSFWWRTNSTKLLRPATIATELMIGGALLAANDWVWTDVNHSQNLASAWPITGVLAAGMAFGRRAGVAAGLFLAVSGYAGILIANGGAFNWSLSRLSSGVLFTLAGWASGYLTFRLRQAEAQIADARAREEVARTLHDGVLQTLAVIQRRSDDQDLATMAREQELELRAFLLQPDRTEQGSTGASRSGDLLASLRDTATRHEKRDGIRVSVVTIDELPTLSAEVVSAVTGAVGEALTNASKHGGARTATVYAEADQAARGAVFCSVKDDGCGFDPEDTTEGIGITRSIRGRISDVSGRVEVRGRAGSGAEVRMWAGP